jgi:hypothetical protein
MLWSFDRRQSLRLPGLGFLAAPAAAFRWQKAPRAPRTRYFCLFSLQERGGGAEGRGDRSARAGYLKSAANDPPDVLNERHKPLVRDPQFTDRRVLAHHRSRVVPRQRAGSTGTALPYTRGTMWGAKIGTSTCSVVTTTFPVVTNRKDDGFELLSRSRFQKYNQNKFWRNI